MQFNPESEGESRIKTLAWLKTPNIMYFNQVDTNPNIFVIIDNDANVLIMRKKDQELKHIGNLYMHAADKEELSAANFAF